MSFPFEQFREEALRKDHSTQFIELAFNYAKILDDKNLPVIFSLEHFAALINIPYYILKEIIEHRFNQYTRYRITKKNKPNEFRYLMSPDCKLLYIQKWINKNILQKVPLSINCTAYCPNGSPYMNAKIHKDSYQVLRIDLLKFFDTITEFKVRDVFEDLGYDKQLGNEFAMLTTTYHNQGFWRNLSSFETHELHTLIDRKSAILPQGGPTSPQLSNIIASGLDQAFESICKEFNCRYSRYADDLIFSTRSSLEQLPNVDILKHVITNEGFFLNEKKTMLFKRGMKQYVTGFTVTHSAKVPKKFRKEIFMHLYFAKKFGPYNHLKMWIEKQGIKRDIIFNFQNWIFGKISFVHSADPVTAKKMYEIYSTIDWTIDETVESLNVTLAKR